ncbi:MAG: cellobiose phosphorylase, partial [Spirochaetes bacterium]|nr:cellobiose phosphorylase [Spirochaetota bacterium]
VLLDTPHPHGSISYDSVKAKREILKKYYNLTKDIVSGKKIKLSIDKLIDELTQKSEWLKTHINKKEYIRIKNGYRYYNGYYDNKGKKVEGDHKKHTRMTLTGQVFPVMFGVGDSLKMIQVIRSVRKFLWDGKLNGLRLNTDFRESYLDLGRAFSFIYGHKENGSFFSHMIVMFANALYKQGFKQDGYKILNSIYRMWSEHDKSMIFPGIPEYFNSSGRGYYHYLTGSASWYVLTMLTEVFGIKGSFGDLMLAPGLVREEFDQKGEAHLNASFAGKGLKVIYQNSKKLEWNKYKIHKILINGKSVEYSKSDKDQVVIKRKDLLQTADKKLNTVIIELG